MGLAMPAALADPTHFGVGSWIERRARIAPDTVALIHDDRSFTYGELAGRVRRLANGLHRLGVARGDRVAWLGANHPSFLEALFASGLLGAALAPVNHRLEPGEIRSILQDAQPTVLFLSDGRPVYPGDVERVLMMHPSIADAGVVLVDSTGGDGVVVALVVPAAGSRTTEQDVLAFGRQHLAPTRPLPP